VNHSKGKGVYETDSGVRVRRNDGKDILTQYNDDEGSLISLLLNSWKGQGSPPKRPPASRRP
jgi:hypothetical protein